MPAFEPAQVEALADAIIRNRSELAAKTDVNWLKWDFGFSNSHSACLTNRVNMMYKRPKDVYTSCMTL